MILLYLNKIMYILYNENIRLATLLYTKNGIILSIFMSITCDTYYKEYHFLCVINYCLKNATLCTIVLIFL